MIILFTSIESRESRDLHQLAAEDNIYISGIAFHQRYTNELLQEHCSSRNVTSQDWWHGSLVLFYPSNLPSSPAYWCRLCPFDIPQDSSLEHLGPVISVARWEQLGGSQTFPTAHPWFHWHVASCSILLKPQLVTIA